MQRCMIDIETLGLEPGVVVLSIGAVKFSEDGVEEEGFYRNISLESCTDAGLEIDPGTLVWWLNRDEEAQHCLTGGDPLSEVLYDLCSFYSDCEEIWANSPSMDCSVLEAAYEAIGESEPWTYKEERDFRTLAALYPEEDFEQEGVEHDALDDAVHQAKVASEILSELPFE